MSASVKIATRLCAKLLDLTFCGYGLVFDILFFRMVRDLLLFYLNHYRGRSVDAYHRLLHHFTPTKESGQAFG